MKYLCLVMIDDATFAGMSPEMRAACAAAQAEFDERLRQQQRLRLTHAIQPANTAVTIRQSADRIDVSVGSSASSIAQLASLHVIEARDLNEAIRLASNMPSGRLGCIEIRPVKESERSMEAR